MKTASIPSLRVTPELREAAESVLEDGETLSSFVEKSLRENIARRRARQEFLARGLTARDEARRSGRYYPAEDLLSELDQMLADAEARRKR